MLSALTEQHRLEQLALRAVTLRDLHKLWPTLDTGRLDLTFPGWAAAVARLIRANNGISAALAARYLRAARAAQRVPGEATVVPAGPPSDEQLATVLRVTSVVAMKSATARGVPTSQASTNAFVLSSGEATRLVLAGGRDTIRESVAADDYGHGWRRVTSGRACEFCLMLAGRGAVYREDTADFASHGHCGCTAEPVWDPTQRRDVETTFTPSARRLTDDTRTANNARAREFIRANNLA